MGEKGVLKIIGRMQMCRQGQSPDGTVVYMPKGGFEPPHPIGHCPLKSIRGFWLTC